MRQLVLRFRADLGERATVAVVGYEHGVVAEARVATLLAWRSHRRTRPRRTARGRRATRPSRPCGSGPPGRRRRRARASSLARLSAYVASSPAKRAVYTPGAPPRASTSRPGVVGDRRQAGRGADRRRLQPGVAVQRVGVLDDVGHVGRARQQLDGAAEDGCDLGDLVRVGRRAHQLQPRQRHRVGRRGAAARRPSRPAGR